MKNTRRKEPCWIVHSHLFEPDEYECSECGAVFKRKAPVCPKCGAAIRRERDTQEWVDEAEEMDWMLGR